MTQLSHSSKEKYFECSEKWRLHYKEKLRSIFINSPLFIGSAMDDAFSRILLERKREHTEEEKALLRKTEFQVFDDAFTNITYNREEIYLPTYEFATYSKSDFDESVMGEEEALLIEGYAEELTLSVNRDNCIEFLDECRNDIKCGEGLDLEEQKLFNYIHWLSCRAKYHILLEAYREEVLPLIEEVFTIQEKVELKEGDDIYIGYIDFTASFVDEPGVVYVVDNKTSSRKYPDDSVEVSEQLASYCEYKEVDKAAYIVVEKKLRKRDPRYRIQVLKGVIPEKTFESTFETIGIALEGIQNQEFEKNDKDAGECFAYGRTCEYSNYCWKNDKKGLTKLSKSAKKD